MNYVLHDITYCTADIAPLYSDREWFNDCLIDLFFARFHHMRGIVYTASKHVLTDSQFLPTLIKRVNGNTEALIQRFRRDVRDCSADTPGLVLIPYCFERHWVLYSVDCHTGVLYICNSYLNSQDNHQQVLQAISHYFKRTFTISELTPAQQQNGDDCGPCVIMNAHYIMSQNKFKSVMNVRSDLRMMARLLFESTNSPLFHQEFSVPCCGVSHRCMEYITEKNSISMDGITVAVLCNDNCFHSITCNRVSNGSGSSDECHRLQQTVTSRLDTLEKSISQDITRRPLKGDESALLLRAYLDSYRQKLQALRTSYQKLNRKCTALQSELQRCLKVDINSPVGVVLRKAIKSSVNWEEDSFLLHYLSRLFQNVAAASANGHRHNDQRLLYFQLYIKYYAGKKVIQILKNIGFADNSTLKRYTPIWKYGDGIIDDFLQTLPDTTDQAEKIRVMIKWDEVDPMRGLEELPKDGKLYVVGMEKVVLAEELDKMTKEEIAQNLGTSVIQFFISYVDGTNAAPLCFYARNKSGDFKQFMSEKLELIFSKVEASGKLIVWATSSDGDPENEKVVSWLAEKYPEKKHVYDCDHFVKNLRNILLRNTLVVDGQMVSVNTMITAYQKLSAELNLPWTSIRPKSTLKWKPVKALMLTNVKLLIQQQDSQLSALGQYLRFMKKLYNAFHNNTLTWEHRNQKMRECRQFFDSRVKMLSRDTKRHVLSAIDNIVHLIEQTPDLIRDKIRFSCLGTIMIENFFSIVRHKQQYFTIADYCMLFSKAWFIMQLTFCDQEHRLFNLPNVTLGKNYGDVQDLNLMPPKLVKRENIPGADMAAQLTPTVRAYLSEFAPERGQITIAQSHKSQYPIYVQCPVKGCKNKHLYSTIGHLTNHMVSCHKCTYASKEEARRSAKTLVQQYLVQLACEDADLMDVTVDESEYCDNEGNVIINNPNVDVLDSSLDATDIYANMFTSVEPPGTLDPLCEEFINSQVNSQVATVPPPRVVVMNTHTSSQTSESNGITPGEETSSNARKPPTRKPVQVCAGPNCCGKGKINQSCPDKSCPLCCTLQHSCRVPSHKNKSIKRMLPDDATNCDRPSKKARLDIAVVDRPVKFILTDFEIADNTVGKRGITDAYAYDLNSKIHFNQGAEYVFPRVPVSWQIERYMTNPITNCMLKNAEESGRVVRENEMFPRYIEFTSCHSGVTIFAAHNCSVERNVINEAISAHSCTYRDQMVLYVDTLVIVRQKLLGLSSYSLGDVYYHLYGETMPDPHRAKGDVEGLLRVLEHNSVRGDQTVQDLLLEYAKDERDVYIYK